MSTPPPRAPAARSQYSGEASGAPAQPTHLPQAAQDQSAEELADALRTSSQDNPGGGNSFTIRGGPGESKKVITEQSKIFLEEPFPTPANLRGWKYKLVTAIQQCTGKTGSAVPDWVYAVEDDNATNDSFRNSGSFATLDLKLAGLFSKSGWMPKQLARK